MVAGIGGGSVLDAAKAIAGLLRVGDSVMDYLEGVGPELPYQGPAVPFIAVPTTAGTGSEATKNAVLSVPGEDGFKKSFRDEQLVPEVAVVDPDLLASCPPGLIAANGMDALTQLLESYVSLRGQPVYRCTGDQRPGGGARRPAAAWYEDQQATRTRPRARHGLCCAAVRHHPGADRPGLGAWPGLAAGRLLSHPARRGLRHPGGRRHAGQSSTAMLAREPRTTRRW